MSITTPDFSREITLWPADQAVRQDVYFQPAVTWLSKAAQGVALLMLEYDSTSAASDKKDFRELVKGLVRWTWEASGLESSAAVTEKDLSDLYDAFAGASLSYTHLSDFLARHYSFVIASFPTPATGVEVEATVFPMFPHLELVVGTKAALSFSPADRTLTSTDISNLRDYFRQLQAQFDTTTRGSTIDAASVAEFIFVGYARLLIRTGIQAALDDLEAGAGTATSIAALLDTVTDATYLNIAQMASRFLLHGFNLPEEVFGGTVAAADEGLYVSTGQQYAFDDALDGDNYTVTLRMGATAETHITFPGEDSDKRAAISYTIAKDATDSLLLAQAQALGSVTDTELDTLHSAAPTLMPYHRTEYLHFALRSRVQWSSSGGTPDYLLPLSASLRDHLRSRDPNPVVDLIVWTNGEPTSAIDIANADFAWATRIELSILQVLDTKTGTPLPDIFELDGSSEEHKSLLEGVWNFLAARNDAPEGEGAPATAGASIRKDPGAVDLTLMYVTDGGTTAPAVATLATTTDDVLLIKANLENDTGSVASQIFSSPFSAKQSFVKLVWEGLDVNSGGYYLHIPAITESVTSTIFKSGRTGVVQLLIAFTDNADPIHDFNNCAVFNQALDSQIDMDADLVLARSNETIPVLTIPAGFLGFEINDRPEIHGPDNPDSGIDELDALYQLLGYQVQSHTRFMASNVGLPIGPTEASASGGASSVWLYERLVPTFSLVPSTTSDANLPDANLDPYRGVGTADGTSAATLRVDTWWQDIYGNQLLARKQTTDFPVRYTDPLIGINQWPSVSENYRFFEDAQGVRQLRLCFSFDTSSYYEDNDPSQLRDNRMASDNATIEQAYYQLIQDDITFELTTSLDDSWSSTAIDKAGLIAFLGEIHQFLAGKSTAAPSPFVQEIDASGIAVKNVFIFEVQVHLAISRSLDRVLDDLKSAGAIKDEYRNVLTASASLSPQYTTNTVTVAAGQSLTDVAAAASLNPAPVYSAADVLNTLSNRLDILNPGSSIDPTSLDVDFGLLTIPAADWTDYVAKTPGAITVQTRDTPHALAVRLRQDMQDKLIGNLGPNDPGYRNIRFSVTDLAAVLHRVPDLLVTGESLPIGGMTIREFASSFQLAFPGLYLAVSEDRALRAQPAALERPLYAVRMDTQGITFDIVQQRPVYFALPPLSNTLLAGPVPLDDYPGWRAGIAANADLDALTYNPTTQSKRFNALDINVLARMVLVVLEEFLEPASLVPAHRLLPDVVARILQAKADLAAAISDDVTPVLARDVSVAGASDGAARAKAALRQQLLFDLVKGYDIETIVQFGVTVNVSESLQPLPWATGYEPRVRGKAKVLGAQVGEGGNLQTIPLRDLNRVLDFSISAGRIELIGGTGDPSSFFTYLFDTKKPELLASVVLDLEFVPLEIEYDITQLSGIASYEASNWLGFVLPDELRQPLGAYPIPIPLRNYPQPPSLIQQTADADPTSRTVLADVRQWKYTIIYEHPDVSQDSVDCILQLNVAAIDNLPTGSGTLAQPSGLFQSLVNFSEVQSLIAQDLEILRASDVLTDTAKSRQAKIALTAFQAVISRVAADWKAWTTGINIYKPGDGDLHFEISEEAGAQPDERQGLIHLVKTVTSQVSPDSILPILQLPGYDQNGNTLLNNDPLQPGSTIVSGDSLVQQFKLDPTDLTFFGDSSIPDRKLMVENLDVIEYQNAWASVWLSRNKHLVEENGTLLPTNPAFIFQTPAVRFNNMVTPFITNDEPWQVATLGSADGKPVQRTLQEHLQTMIDILFPTFPGNKYDVRLSCRYAFALATGRGLNEDLVTTLPILLGLRVTPEVMAAGYARDLTTEVRTWLATNRPSMERASLMFMVDLFSKLDPDSNTSLPMLRITHLSLPLNYVSDM